MFQEIFSINTVPDEDIKKNSLSSLLLALCCAMANSGAPNLQLHPLAILFLCALTVTIVVALGFLCALTFTVVAADVGGQLQTNPNQCPPFSCGHLHNVSSPFRRPGDPAGCGVPAYELACSSSKATIRINTGTYFVTNTRYTDESFWVVDANWDVHSSCPLPRSDHRPYTELERSQYWPRFVQKNQYWPADGYADDLAVNSSACSWALFVNCSRPITTNPRYKPVACLSANSSFVYVLSGEWVGIQWLEPSCRYLGIIPFFYPRDDWDLPNISYVHIAESIGRGFPVLYPLRQRQRHQSMKFCVDYTVRYFKDQISNVSIVNWARAFFWSEIIFIQCIDDYVGPTNRKFRWLLVAEVPAFDIIKCIAVWSEIVRLVLAPLAVLTFLAHKYWKTRITIDAVEKFLRMQEMIGPIRFAYTDIIAITSHLRDRLGQGGYGSVYRGVLHPGDVHVAVKMLNNTSCNGEEFISEVATIGRIHHVNVVRLVGFCSEEMRRALVYEFMPCGSLDKYIFSSQRSFSWDKLNEIALGIARGIDYLHRGCDMQILHFDIKPHNILLDSNFVPKVADFGLAKLYPREKSFVPASALRGTVGYIAPEMISRSFGAISSKSDVYSFGMLLLEMAGGRRNANNNTTNSSRAYYPSWVYDRLTEQQEAMGEISTTAADDAANMHELEKKLCIVGLCCIQMMSKDRPAMSKVIEMLEGSVDGLHVPSRPFFCDDEHIPLADSYHFSSELTAISEEDE